MSEIGIQRLIGFAIGGFFALVLTIAVPLAFNATQPDRVVHQPVTN